MDSILFGLSTVGPIFIIIGIGAILRRLGILHPSTAGEMTRLVFHLFLPALILKALFTVDFVHILSFRILIVVWGTLFLVFALAWFTAKMAGAGFEKRGFFASGSTWSNVAIIGYAMGEALYGEEGLGRAAILSALVLPLNTPLGYLFMDKHADGEGTSHFKIGLKRLLTNPVMISIVLGLIVNLLPITLPIFVFDTLEILGRASLSLALIAIGASLEFSRDPAGWTESLCTVPIKLFVMPLFVYFGARWAGLSEAWIGTMVIGFACPTAVSFFVVSQSLGYEASRGAAVVTATTVASALSIGLATILLRIGGIV